MSNYVEERPWGKFEILYDGDDCKVKKITVNPGGRLSLQSHTQRQEIWTVVSGQLGVDLGVPANDEKGNFSLENTMGMLKKSYHTFDGHLRIPQGWVHRAFNVGSEPAIFIEVQTGTYFGEDDITRYEDDYGRVE